jgi:hypothetical protein
MQHVRPASADYRVTMSADPNPDSVLAYETQARYAPGEAWVTLDVSVSRQLAVDEAFFRRDPWGRVPTEIRVRRITPGLSPDS